MRLQGLAAPVGLLLTNQGVPPLRGFGFWSANQTNNNWDRRSHIRTCFRVWILPEPPADCVLLVCPSPDPASLRCGCAWQNIWRLRDVVVPSFKRLRGLLLQCCCCSRTSLDELRSAIVSGCWGLVCQSNRCELRQAAPHPHLFRRSHSGSPGEACSSRSVEWNDLQRMTWKDTNEDQNVLHSLHPLPKSSVSWTRPAYA